MSFADYVLKELPEGFNAPIYDSEPTEQQMIEFERAMFAEDVLRGEITEEDFNYFTGINYQQYLYEQENKS